MGSLHLSGWKRVPGIQKAVFSSGGRTRPWLQELQSSSRGMLQQPLSPCLSYQAASTQLFSDLRIVDFAHVKFLQESGGGMCLQAVNTSRWNSVLTSTRVARSFVAALSLEIFIFSSIASLFAAALTLAASFAACSFSAAFLRILALNSASFSALIFSLSILNFSASCFFSTLSFSFSASFSARCFSI